MKYDLIARQLHFYNFVFYETEKNKMYVYCPNCNSEHEIDMRDVVPKHENSKVAWIKKNHKPCCCFEGRMQPKFLRSDCEYKKVKTYIDVAEFCKHSNGGVTVEAYRQTASFAASNYYDAKPFRREPVFEEDNSTTFTFREGEKTKIESCLYVPMCTSVIKVGSRWRNVKNWRRTIEFELLDESLEELKGTYLEKHIADINKFQEELSRYTNLEYMPMGEYTVQFLRLICENTAFFKIWKAGFYTLAIQRVFESLMPFDSYYGTPSYSLDGACIDKKITTTVINWRGKTLERILKVNIQKLDNLYDRSELNVDELKGVRMLEKLNIAYSVENVEIVGCYRFENLKDIIERDNLPPAKVFKYLRNQSKKAKNMNLNELVNDYYDYLSAVKELNTPLTADVVFPTLLIASHDKAVAERQTYRNKSKNLAFKKATEKYKAFNFENDKYKIFVIGNVETLMQEAAKLHNCSAGYVDRIINGTSVIFLIREKAHPRKSFYMLELNPNTFSIVQNRGLHNCSATDTVKNFAELWRRSVVVPKASKLKKAA